MRQSHSEGLRAIEVSQQELANVKKIAIWALLGIAGVITIKRIATNITQRLKNKEADDALKYVFDKPKEQSKLA